MENQTVKENRDTSTVSTKNVAAKNKQNRKSGQIFDKLTQIETLNVIISYLRRIQNIYATFSGICMLMDDVYDLYQDN